MHRIALVIWLLMVCTRVGDTQFCSDVPTIGNMVCTRIGDTMFCN